MISSSELLSLLTQDYPEISSTNFSIEDWAYALIRPMLAFVCSTVFWPIFEEFENMVFLKLAIEDDPALRQRIRNELAKGATLSTIESSFNRFYVDESLFRGKIASSDFAVLEKLTETIVEMWQAKLKRDFPSREFSVHVDKSENDQDAIVVFEIR